MKKVVLFNDRDFDGYTVGIFEEKDGSFTAMTATWSKNYKTFKGAIKGLSSRLSDKMLKKLQEVA